MQDATGASVNTSNKNSNIASHDNSQGVSYQTHDERESNHDGRYAHAKDSVGSRLIGCQQEPYQ